MIVLMTCQETIDGFFKQLLIKKYTIKILVI